MTPLQHPSNSHDSPFTHPKLFCPPMISPFRLSSPQAINKENSLRQDNYACACD